MLFPSYSFSSHNKLYPSLVGSASFSESLQSTTYAMALAEIPKSDETATNEDIERCLSETNPNEKATRNNQADAREACHLFGTYWMIFFILTFMVTGLYSLCTDNSRTLIVASMSCTVMADGVIAGSIITALEHPRAPRPWGWRVFYLYVYQHISTLAILLVGAALQRNWKFL